jgi:hypothetical protein
MNLLAAGAGLGIRLAQGTVIFITKALCISLTGHLYLSLIESKYSPLVLMSLIPAVIATAWLLTI